MKKIKLILIVLINFIFLNSFSQNEYVVEIDRANGTFLKNGPAISGITWVYPNFRAYNENNGIFIFPSSDTPTRLYSIDVSNDSIINNPVYSNLLVEFEYSDTSNILYGLLKDNTNNVKYLASINQFTGGATIIGSSIPTANTYQGLSTFNQHSNQYIFLDPSFKLFSIDVTNGNVVSNPALVLPVNHQLLSIAFNDSTNTLYGLLLDNSINKHYLVSINTTTGIVTILGAGATFGNSGSSAIDQINQQYIYLYYNGSYSIATMDISTGNVVYNAPLVTFASTDNFFSLKYDNVHGKLYSIHWGIPCYTNNNVSASICQGDTYTFPDATTSTTSIIHTSHINTINFCDSSVVTTLTVNPHYVINTSASICQGETFTFPDATTSTTATIHTCHLNTINFCDSSITTTLTVNSLFTKTDSASICQGDTYTFPDATTSTTATIHTSHLNTINFCDSSIVTTLTVNSLPIVSIDLSSVDTLCQSEGVVNLIGGNPIGGTYSGIGIIGNTFNTNIAGLGNNPITYTITDVKNSCANSATESIYIDACNGITAITIDNLFYIYPNPTDGHFTISLPKDNAEIAITDILGRQIIKTNATQKIMYLQLDNNGVYIVNIKTKEGITARKLIVNH